MAHEKGLGDSVTRSHTALVCFPFLLALGIESRALFILSALLLRCISRLVFEKGLMQLSRLPLNLPSSYCSLQGYGCQSCLPTLTDQGAWPEGTVPFNLRIFLFKTG